MKKTKSFLALFLALTVMLLTGCSSINNEVVTVTATKAPAQENKGFIELSGVDDNVMTGYIASDFYGDLLLIGVSEYNEEENWSIIGFYIFNVNENNLVSSIMFPKDYMINGMSSAKFDGDGNICVVGWKYDVDKRIDAVYDQSFNLLSSKTTNTDFDDTEYDNKNPLVNDDFSYFNSLAFFNREGFGDKRFTAVGFYDEDCLYFPEVDEQYYVTDYDKKVLTYNDDMTFEVNDYNKFQVVNKTKAPVVENAKCVGSSFGCLGDKYAFAIIDFDNGDDVWFQKAYVWEYGVAAKNKPIDYEKCSKNDVETKTNELISSIKEKYNVNITIDKKGYEYIAPVDSEGEAGLDYGASYLFSYYIVSQLDVFNSMLPDNFTYEMFGDYINSENASKGFDINIIKNIKGNSAAFAFTDESLHIFFATDEFDISQIPHEYMHLIDDRIYDYYSTVEVNGEKFYNNFDLLWSEYNPDNFVYDFDQDYDSKYFVSFYSMTNCLEDRAETFMYLCCDSFGSDWYKDNEPLKKKADFLIKSIYDAFPSAQKADNLLWTKNIN